MYQIQYSCIICDFLLRLKRRFRDGQIVIIINFVFASSVGVKRVVCTNKEELQQKYCLGTISREKKKQQQKKKTKKKKKRKNCGT